MLHKLQLREVQQIFLKGGKVARQVGGQCGDAVGKLRNGEGEQKTYNTEQHKIGQQNRKRCSRTAVAHPLEKRGLKPLGKRAENVGNDHAGKERTEIIEYLAERAGDGTNVIEKYVDQNNDNGSDRNGDGLCPVDLRPIFFHGNSSCLAL